MPASRPLEDRFWAKVAKSHKDGCWLWTGTTSGGYGRICEGTPSRRMLPSHRVAYELLVGPIPDGLEIDHLCRVTRCVNPAHMEPVTHQENTRRGLSGALQVLKTHCPRGHPYSGTNLYVGPEKGDRQCRTCKAENQRQRRKSYAKNS